MNPHVDLAIQPQPDLVSCGPTCLHALYGFWGDDTSLSTVLSEVQRLPHGGTLAALLACHALARGYRALLYTFDLEVFDPTWFGQPERVATSAAPRGSSINAAPRFASRPTVDLAAKLRAVRRHRRGSRVSARIRAYLEVLDRGGRIAFEDLTPQLLESWLSRGVPLLTGLSATYLYRSARERVATHDPHLLIEDDVAGLPTGHFVVLHGLDRERGEVRVADPLQPNPVSRDGLYSVEIHRLVAAILLGVTTDDANLLILQPPRGPQPLD